MEAFKQTEQEYHLLGEHESKIDDAENLRQSPPPRRHSPGLLFVVLSILGLVVLSGVAGFNVGKISGRDGPASPVTCKLSKRTIRNACVGIYSCPIVQTITTSLVYNRTFAESPTPENDAAWDSLFPPHGGFFHDKTIAEEGASLAAYHQLHCLVSS